MTFSYGARFKLLAAFLAMLIAVPLLAVLPQAAAESDTEAADTGIVTLKKTVSSQNLKPGDELQYSFELSCSGLTTPCIDATLTDVLPAEFTVVSLPSSSNSQQVNFDPATRELTVRYTTDSGGSIGLPAGATRKVVVSMRVPKETDLTNGDKVNNEATFQGSNTNTVTDNVQVTINVPRVVRPVADKSWSPGSAVAQSGAKSHLTLKVRNASSTSAEVTDLLLSDIDIDTFNKFNVTSIGPVAFPPGADRVVVSACINNQTTCTAESPPQSGPDLTLPSGIRPQDVTGLEFRFFSANGAVLPYSPDNGNVRVGLELRDTLRSDGSEYQPLSRDKITNTVKPAAIDKVDGKVTGKPDSANYYVNPNIVKVRGDKRFCSDTNESFSCDGHAVEGTDAGIAMNLGGRNVSGFPVARMKIVEPDPSVPAAVENFKKTNISKIRITPPSHTQRSTVEVVCRSGSTSTKTYNNGGSHTLQLGRDFCADGDFPSSVSVTYDATRPNGDGNIPNNAHGKLDLAGKLNDRATAGRINNCVRTEVSNPVNQSGSGVASTCSHLTVQQQKNSGSGTKSSDGVTTIVPGQEMDFKLSYKNTGNLPVSNVVMVDPPDPRDPNGPFKSVRIVRASTYPSHPAARIQVFDPQADSYVDYDKNNAALLARATGLRLRTTEPLSPGKTVTLHYTVVLRDGVVPPGGELKFENCAAVGVGQPDVDNPFCNRAGEITTVEPANAASQNKTFAPAELERPQPGQSPGSIKTTDLKLQIKNDGPMYLNKFVITDIDKDFFDAYDFRGDNSRGRIRVNFPRGANRVQLDACTSAADCDSGNLVTGNPTGSRHPELPAGVSPKDVVGFRITFTRSDGEYKIIPAANFPNGGDCRQASVCVKVAPRIYLRSAPDQQIPDEVENTVSAAGKSLLQDPNKPDSVFDIPDVSATMRLHAGPASMSIKKYPNSRIAPGQPAPFTLVIENTGKSAIPDLRVVDPIPDKLNFDLNMPGTPTGQPYLIDYQVPAGTPEPSSVDFTAVPDPNDPNQIIRTVWQFPDDYKFLPGSKITISFQVILEPGTQAGTEITNKGRTTSNKDGFKFACTGDDSETINDQLWCTSTAKITTLEGTSFSANKWVAGDAKLGFLNSLTGQVTPVSDQSCPRINVNNRVYTRYPCVALNYPGQGFDFIIRLTNSGNSAIADPIKILDTLPVMGDRGILLNGQERGTEWTKPPRLLTAPSELTNFGVGQVEYTTFDTVNKDICFETLTQGPGLPADLPVGCEKASWTANYPADRDQISALQGVIDFTDGLKPGQSAIVTARVSSPLTMPVTKDSPVAWNSFVHEDVLTKPNGEVIRLAPTEPIKAGIAVMYGQVEISKRVTNPPPGINLPAFPMEYDCKATPEGGVETTVARGTLDVLAGQTVPVPGMIPAGAECEFWETDANGGQSSNLGQANAKKITIEPSLTRDGPQVVRITNDFPTGELVIGKSVAGNGLGIELQDGSRWGDGPFQAEVDCTYPGTSGDSLTGFPRTVKLKSGETTKLAGITIGSVCKVVETVKGSASSVQIAVDGGSPIEGSVASVPIEKRKHRVDYTNRFEVGQLEIEKEITGDGAGFADRDFVFSIDCARPDADFKQVTATIDRPGETSVVVKKLPAGSVCAVHETDDGGAEGPNDPPGKWVGTVTIVKGERPLVSVTATNNFPAGRVSLLKTVDGPGAPQAPTEFDLTVSCQRTLPDGTVSTFLTKDVKATSGTPVTLTEPIPVGASCWAQEKPGSGATHVSIDYDSPDNAIEVTEESLAIGINAVNYFGVGGLKLTKEITGPGAKWADGTFELKVACSQNGQKVLDKTVGLTKENPTATLQGVPAGAVCDVTELPPYGGADGPASIVGSPATIIEGQETDVTATNNFSVGEIRVTKEVVNQGVDLGQLPPLEFVLEVTCQRQTPTGGWITIIDGQQVTLKDGDVKTVADDLPIGTRCWAVETDRQGATQTEVDHHSPDTAVIVTLPQVPGDPIDPVQIKATNTYHAGGLTINKELTGAAAGSGAEFGPFRFQVACMDDGQQVTPFILTITPPQTSAGRGGLPAGSVCSVVELPPYGGADGPANIPPITIPDETEQPPIQVNATNTFSAGTLQVNKKVTGPRKDIGENQEFPIQVVCTYDGLNGVKEIVNQTLVVPADSSLPLGADLPYGTECSAEELNLKGATSVEITPEKITIEEQDGPFTFEVKNIYESGPLKVIKKITGPGDKYADRPFTVTATCRLNGQLLPLESVTITPPDTKGAVSSLPTGAVCDLTETDPGGADGPGVISPSRVTIGKGAENPATVEVTNHFSIGEITLKKELTGPAAGLVPTDTEYELRTVCTRDSISGPSKFVDKVIKVGADGAEVPLGEDLPIGAKCSVTEVLPGDPDDPASVVIAPANPIEITLDNPKVTVTATNEYRLGGFELTKKLEGPGVPAIPAGTEFKFDVECKFLKSELERKQVTLTAPRGLVQQVTGLPVGAECMLTELPPYGGSDGPAIVVPQPVIVAEKPEEAPALATDKFSAGSLTVAKRITGPGKNFVPASTEYELKAVCVRRPGSSDELVSKTVKVKADGTPVLVADGLPIGAECKVAEKLPGKPDDPDSVSYDPGDIVQITLKDPFVTITAVNHYKVGGFELTKKVKGPAAGFVPDGTEFNFDVACKFLESGVTKRQVKLTYPDQMTAEVTDLPVGAKCGVTELPPYGGADGGVAITPDEVTVTAKPAEAPVKAVNTYNGGSITLDKSFAGEGKQFASGREFTFQVDCVRDIAGIRQEILSEEITLTTEQPTWSNSPIPTGAKCWATEVDSAGATSVEIDHDSEAAAVEVTTDEPDARINAQNTFDLAGLTVKKSVVNQPAGVNNYSVQVSCTQETGSGLVDVMVPGDGSGDAGAYRISAGETISVQVPPGTKCTVAEFDVPTGATVSYQDSDGSTPGGTTDGVVQVPGSGASVDITNTFPAPTTPPTPTAPPTVPPTAPPGNVPAVTGTSLPLLVGGLGLLMLVVGGSAVWFSRRNPKA